MNLVLDASAGVELVMAQPHAEDVRLLIDKSEWVLAPDLYLSEITNVFWKYFAHHDVPLAACETMLQNALIIPDKFINMSDIALESFSLACLTRMSVYDMSYLVVARRYNATLVTLDKKLQQVSKKQSVRVWKF